MFGQALDEPALAASVIQGTKRKASYMGDLEPSQKDLRTFPPIKLEPGTTNEKDDVMSMGQSEAELALKARLNTPSRDMSAAFRQEAEIDTARVPLHNSEGEINGLMRLSPVLNTLPPPHWQNAGQRPKVISRHSRTVRDVLYDSIPDYAPPISTLPTGNPHILQVHWPQKAVVDLSNDPDRHMLHEAEIKLATSLNLSCAKYLCTKRRIFQARFKALQEGREFRKSDSQRACKINTNKASKICGAFEKVGWLDKKHFFRHLEDSNDAPRKSSDETNHADSSSSELSERDIWDVSESEFHFTSEGDEDSTDEDTAGSSVSFDGTRDQINGRKSLEAHLEPLLRRQPFEFSAMGEVEKQGQVRNDTAVQTSDTFSMDDTGDEGSMNEDRRSEPGFVLKNPSYSSKPAGPSADDTENFPLLETRSMTQKLKFAQNSHSEDKSISLATIETRNSHQRSTSEKAHQRPFPTDLFALRYPIPKSLDEANAADVMLVEMKEKSRPWFEIEEAWEKKTGKAQTKKSLSRRYLRIMGNLASARGTADEKVDKSCSLTHPRLKQADMSDDESTLHPKLSSGKEDQLLLAAEAEVEGNYQREKAEILAEIESNFQSVKWDLIAEAMSRAGSATYSAESVQAQHEKLANESREAAAKEESKRATYTDLSRQDPSAVGGGKFETLAPSRSGAGRLTGASNAINSPADRVDRGHQKFRKSGPQKHAEHSARMRKVWAKRRALGTHGHHGGPPKASTTAKQAKMAFPTTKPNAGNSLAPTGICPSGQTAQDPLSNQKQPIMVEDQVGRDVNRHRHSLAHIIPAAALVGSGSKCTTPARNVSM